MDYKDLPIRELDKIIYKRRTANLKVEGRVVGLTQQNGEILYFSVPIPEHDDLNPAYLEGEIDRLVEEHAPYYTLDWSMALALANELSLVANLWVGFRYMLGTQLETMRRIAILWLEKTARSYKSGQTPRI